MRAETVRVGLLWGLAFGFLEMAYFSQVNEAFPVAFPHFIVAILVGAGYAAAALVLSWLVSQATKRFGDSGAVLAMLAGPWCMLLALAVSQHRYRMEIFSRGMAKNVASLVIFLGVTALFLVIWRLLARRRAAAARLLLVAGIVLCAFGVFELATAHLELAELPPAGGDPVGEAGGAWDTDLRVMLIGLDGGPWKVLDPLMAEGKMPNLAKIAALGVTANLENIIPTYSPPIWTSIATGKSPDRHGIHDFLQTVLPLGLPTVPFKVKALRTLTIPARKVLRLSNKIFHYKTVYLLSGHVRARRLWDILESHDMPTVVVDWYVTYPVEGDGGIHVSDHFHMHKGKTSDIPGLIAPAELAPRFEPMIITPDELPEEKIDALLDRNGLGRAGRRRLKEQFPDWFTMVEGGMARDLTHKAIFDEALKERPDWRFAAVYFRAMDNMHHASWHYNDLPGDSLDVYPERRFRNAVRRYYDHCDALLDGIADYVDSNTVVIVMSDHGWDDAATAHNFAPDGFFAMAGGPVPHREARERIHVYDITPTVLSLLGLPVGGDMEGSAAADMVSAEFRRDNPFRTIPTYETEQRSGAAPDMQMDEETIKELKALGYIN